MSAEDVIALASALRDRHPELVPEPAVPNGEGSADSMTRRSGSRRRLADAGFLASVALGGFLFWLLYVAVQPRDYDLSPEAPNRLDTMFGWRAPGIGTHDLIERDRLYLALAGWLLIGFVAGRLRPSLWRLIGVCLVVPTMLVYFAMAPHDAQGYWPMNVIYLPLAGLVVAGIAKEAPQMDALVAKPALLGCLVGVLFGGALLVGGGESSEAVIGVGVIAALITGAVALAARGRAGSPLS